MNPRLMSPLPDLGRLPAAIWIPAGGSEPAFYRGSPLEMVRSMAEETDAPTLTAAVGVILAGLARNRRIVIRLPGGLSDESLARLFVFALLETGIGKPMPSA